MRKRFIILLALFVLTFSAVLAESTEHPDINGKWSAFAYQFGENAFVDSKLFYSQCDMEIEKDSAILTYNHNALGRGINGLTLIYVEDHIEEEYMDCRIDFLTQEDLKELTFEAMELPELKEDLILKFDDTHGMVILFLRVPEEEAKP